MKILTIILCLALAQCGLSSAWADTVSVPDAPPAVEDGGLTPADIAAAMSAGPVQTVMLVTVPTDPTAEIAPARVSKLPVTAYAGTGQETRLGVDLSSINSQAEREGWPWYAWAGIIVGSVAVIGLTAWAVSEAAKGGGHSNDSSHHTDVTIDGDGNTVHVHPDSWEASSSSSRTGY